MRRLPKYMRKHLRKNEQPIAMVLVFADGAQVCGNIAMHQLAYLLHYTAVELNNKEKEAESELERQGLGSNADPGRYEGGLYL